MRWNCLLPLLALLLWRSFSEKIPEMYLYAEFLSCCYNAFYSYTRTVNTWNCWLVFWIELCMLHNSPQMFKKSLPVKNFVFFFIWARDRTYGLRRGARLHVYRRFCIIGYIFKIRIILYKLKLGSRGGNILNNTNLFLKISKIGLCAMYFCKCFSKCLLFFAASKLTRCYWDV